MRFVKLAAVSLVVLLGLGACGDKATEGFHDAHRSGTTNRDSADIVTMPDGFSNLSTKCDHGNRVYVAFHGDSGYAALAVVPHDSTC